MFLSAIICGLISIYSLGKSNHLKALTLGLLSLALSLWSAAYGFELLSGDLQVMRFFTKISYPGIATVPAFFFLFVMAFADRRKWFSPFRLDLIFAVPIITNILVWTNESHHLYYTLSAIDPEWPFPIQELVRGPFYWVFITYSYLMLSVGILILAREWFFTEKAYRKQIDIILLGALVPILVNLSYLFRIIPVGYIDLTPVAFSITGMFIAFSIFRFEILDLRPIARETIIERMQEGIVVVDETGILIDVNASACDFLSMDKSNLVRSNFTEVFSPIPTMREFIDSTASHVELTLKERYLEIRKNPIFSKSGKLRGHILLIIEITKRKQAEKALKHSEERLMLAVKGGNIGLWDWKVKSDEIEFNDRYVQMIGYPAGEVHLDFQAWKNLIHPDDLIPTLEALENCYEGRSDYFESEYRMLSKSGTWVWVYDRGEVAEREKDGSPIRLVGTHIDITSRKLVEEALRESQELYKKLATTDMLTGVLNRYSLNHLLEVETERAKRYAQPLSLIMFDVDDLKKINDKFGHLTGDLALKAITEKVLSKIRKSDSLARWGGDEFVIVTPGTTLNGAREMAEKLKIAIASITLPNVENVSVSMGISSFKEGDSEYDDILRRTDRALYISKNLGKNSVTVG